MVSHSVKVAIQAVMAVVIVVLFVWLVESIIGPWRAVEREREITAMTQQRMSQVRLALVRYERIEDRFPGNLDSLMMWVRTDSIIMSSPDSIFETVGFNLDSLVFSPRTGKEFIYALNDTGRVAIYLLKDPDTDDHIGSDIPDITLLNAASWE